MTQNACPKTNTLPKRKNYTDYTMICMHYLVWSIVLEISNEIAKKNPTQRNSEQKHITMTRGKLGFASIDNNRVINRKQQEKDR